MQVQAAGDGATSLVAAIPVEAVVASLLRPLLQDRDPLPAPCEYFYARRTRGGQERRKSRLTVEWVGR